MTTQLEKIGIFKEADLSKLAKGIIESYHYETDFLSELLQNAVDSIRRAGKKGIPKIEIEYDAPKGLFTVIDYGTGMTAEELKLFALGRTDKPADLRALLIGEKGVGGSYVLCISDFFEVESVKEGEKVRAICEKARDNIWENREPTLTLVERAKVSGIPNYTKISVRSIAFKTYSKVDDLIEDIRMFTAVGNTRKPFGEPEIDIKIDVSFVTRDEYGKEERISRTAEFSFPHPAIEYADKVIWFDELEAQAKGKKLDLPDGVYKDKLLGVMDKKRRILAVFGREEILTSLGIAPLIVLGVKGAPMPVELSPPKTGYAGYWRNLFILINRDEVDLDVGRKSITLANKREINESLREFFNERVVKYAKLFIEPKAPPIAGALDQIREQAKSKIDLHIPQIKFAKVPTKGEELAVVGIFHEIVGCGLLEGYYTLSESSDAPYDAVIKYSIPISKLGSRARERVMDSFRKVHPKPDTYMQVGFVEFKVDATEFMSDCDRGKKNLEDVMLVVAYTLNRNRIRKGWRVEHISEDIRIFNGAKWKLVHEGLGREVPLILLEEFKYKGSKEK
jgi:hypothetical protein